MTTDATSYSLTRWQVATLDNLLHAFGGAGEGPGELIDAATLQLNPAIGVPLLWTTDPDRRLIQQVRRMTLPGQPAATAEPADLLLAMDRNGAVADTLAVLPVGETFGTGGEAMTIRLFAPETVWALLPGGRFVTGLNGVRSPRR